MHDGETQADTADRQSDTHSGQPLSPSTCFPRHASADFDHLSLPDPRRYNGCTASLQVEVGMDRPTGNRLLTTRLLTADC